MIAGVGLPLIFFLQLSFGCFDLPRWTVQNCRLTRLYNIHPYLLYCAGYWVSVKAGDMEAASAEKGTIVIVVVIALLLYERKPFAYITRSHSSE